MVADEMAVLLPPSEHRRDPPFVSVFQILLPDHKAWLVSVAARQSDWVDKSGWNALLRPHGSMMEAPAQALASPVTVALLVPADA